MNQETIVKFLSSNELFVVLAILTLAILIFAKSQKSSRTSKR